jgi:predicted transcriptional regulator of viral defense system
MNYNNYNFVYFLYLLKITILRNRISYLDFQKQLKIFEIFNLNLIHTYYPKFDNKRLFEWHKKSYILKLVKGWYCFSETNITEYTLFRWSNLIRKPSYISLESAFNFYGFIPEQSFEIKAVCTLKTMDYNILHYRFIYNTIAPKLLFGYDIIYDDNKPIAIAKLEKSILDYLYLNSNITELSDFESLRWNIFQSIDWDLFDNYLSVFNNKNMMKRAELFKKYMQ